MPYNRRVKNLSLSCLTPEQHAQTCGYWYCVQTDCMAWTAFATVEGLNRWLDERGLSLSEPLPPAKTHQWQPIIGEYIENSHMSYDEFYALKGPRTKVLSNANYTMGIITTDENGIKVVNYLNCNCKDRTVYEYFSSHKEMN